MAAGEKDWGLLVSECAPSLRVQAGGGVGIGGVGHGTTSGRGIAVCAGRQRACLFVESILHVMG
jgi:hypothetical protein